MNRKQIDRLFTVEDKDGNGFFCIDGKIVLRLKAENKERVIGKVYYKNGGIVYKKYETVSGIFRQTNSWSLPLFIYDKVDRIWFYTDETNYKLYKKDVDSSILHFRNAGIEKKVYIPLDSWTKN